MKKILGIVVLGLLLSGNAYSLPECEGDDSKKWTNCQGSFKYPEKEYNGEWKNGKKHGEGYSYFPNGSYYFGEFKDDKPNGEGIAIIKYNLYYSKIVGKWKDGKPNGQGDLSCLRYHDVKYSYEWEEKNYTGEWKDGVLKIKNVNGKEAHIGAEKCVIWIGKLKDGLMHGYGTAIFPDGIKYVGEAKNDDFHGQVTIYKPDGKIEKAIYKDGKYLKKIK
jgi:hypothetical protein